MIAEGGQLYYRWDKVPSRRWLMPTSDIEFLDRTESAKIRVERDGDGPAKRLTMTWGAGGPGIVYRRLALGPVTRMVAMEVAGMVAIAKLGT